jgi:ribose 5-phosphate isomerase B
MIAFVSPIAPITAMKLRLFSPLLPAQSGFSRKSASKRYVAGVESSRPAHYVAVMRIAIASDHAATDLKAQLARWLMDEGHEVADLGPDAGESVDYPDYGYKLAEVVAEGTVEFGIALCGSGVGISISVNRHPALRCALVSEPVSAALAREHNNANAIALGARLIGIEMAKSCVATFLKTEFADAKNPAGRHQRRVAKLSNPPTQPDHIETHQ